MYQSKYRSLILVGNGFDRWQGLPTAYGEFRKYYAAHIDEAMSALSIPSKSLFNILRNADWRGILLPDEADFSQEYFVYFKKTGKVWRQKIRQAVF